MDEEKVHVRPERLNPLVYENKTFKSSDDFSLTEEDFEKAHLEFHETSDVRNSALQQFRAKMDADPSTKYRTDENYLLRYLRYTKFDVDKAYKFLRRFYDFREKYPGVFSISDVERLYNVRFITYLPYADEDGCIVFWLNFRNWNIDECSIWEIFSVYHVLADIQTVNPNVQIHGIKGIWDLRGVGMRHVAHTCKPSTIIFLIKMLQDVYPWKLKRLVTLYTGSIMQGVYNATSYLIKKKIRDRFVLLGSDIGDLHKYFNPAIVPKEYGGSLEVNDCYDVRHVMENMNYLKYERTFGPIKESSCN